MAQTASRVATELEWAWRHIRARGGRSALVVALLAAALAANTIVFSAADALVFHRIPFRDPDRLVEIQWRSASTGRTGDTVLAPALFDEWRRQADLFEGVGGHVKQVIFLTNDGAAPELVNAADVTVGLPEVLGVRPRWGRTLLDGDDRQVDPQPALVAWSLARDRFGDPARAVGQTIGTTAERLLVVGVMPPGFRYPDASTRIWRALDPRGSFNGGGVDVASIARFAPTRPAELTAKAVAARSAAVGRAAGAPSDYAAVVTPLRSGRAGDAQRRTFMVLLGAALCLLLTACASVASLELAGAVGRAKTYAIQVALGASRLSLVRTALAEGLMLVSAATLVAAGLASRGADALGNLLPRRLSVGGINAIDLDGRAFAYMIGVAAIAWLLAVLPVALFAARANLFDVLKLEGGPVTASRHGSRLRRVLTVAEIAFAVVLLTGSLLYVRSYLRLVAIDKGFDSTGVAAISLTIPPQFLESPSERERVAEEILARVRALPGVVGAFQGFPPPDTGDSVRTIERVQVDDRQPMDTDLQLPRLHVEPDYFRVLRIPLLSGRMLQPGDELTDVLISEALARRLWPTEDAAGHRFRALPGGPWHTVIGVVGHVRLIEDGTTGPSRIYQTYVLRKPPVLGVRQPPPPPPRERSPRSRYAQPSSRRLTITVRLDSPALVDRVRQVVRSVEPACLMDVEFIDDRYARQFEDRLLATRVVSAFGVLAFIVAAAGIYGLLAFLVATRSREIGVRIAMGASGGDIGRMVVVSSLRLVAGGVALGTAGALALSRWIESQLFGVRGTDPLTLAGVALMVAVTSILAAWRPARQAARVDPTQLLRG